MFRELPQPLGNGRNAENSRRYFADLRVRRFGPRGRERGLQNTSDHNYLRLWNGQAGEARASCGRPSLSADLGTEAPGKGDGCEANYRYAKCELFAVIVQLCSTSLGNKVRQLCSYQSFQG